MALKDTEWHLEKRVSIGLIVTMLLYGFGSVVAWTELRSTVNHMNDQTEKNRQDDADFERFVRNKFASLPQTYPPADVQRQMTRMELDLSYTKRDVEQIQSDVKDIWNKIFKDSVPENRAIID